MTQPTGNYTYLRQLREAAARRRLEIAKLLRDDPATTNLQLAKALNVSRNTITLDRKLMVEELKNETLSETELLRADMLQRLEKLHHELELHRRDGKLPVSVIHEGLLVTRSIIELLGVRKPVTEHLEVKRSSISFEVEVVPSPKLVDGKQVIEISEPKTFSLVRNTLALRSGEQDANH